MISGDKVTMGNQEDKLVKLVAKLIELTQESELYWKVVDSNGDSEPSMTKIIGAVFESNYKDKTLRIYKREYNNTEENHMLNLYQPSYSIAVELAFSDKQGNIIWRFPRVTGIIDLYKAVTYRVADVDDFINDVLMDDED